MVRSGGYYSLKAALQQHQSDTRVLNRRTLQNDHRYLATLLRPGASVLDVGFGTGAITVGIAAAVGPEGSVVGVERDEDLLERARKEHSAITNLRFEHGDATSLTFRDQFDIVTAARTLQWIAEPRLAVERMKAAAKPGSGLVVILDYNLAANEWDPDPPAAFCDFYQAFLDWREASGWDNHMADRLPELFQAAGLVDIESHIQDEIAERDSPHFEQQAKLWPWVIENIGERIVQAGFLADARLQDARLSYGPWAETKLVKQILRMRTVVGMVP